METKWKLQEDPDPVKDPDPQRRQPRDHLKTFLLARLSLIVEISIAHGNEDNSLRPGLVRLQSSPSPIIISCRIY